MKTLTLKTDEGFFNKVTELATHLHLSKSELIRRSIVEYEKVMQRKELKEQMKHASLRVRKANANLNKEFDVTSQDGLDNV